MKSPIPAESRGVDVVPAGQPHDDGRDDNRDRRDEVGEHLEVCPLHVEAVLRALAQHEHAGAVHEEPKRRDEEHGAAFIQRHQNKLLYGSDCNDRIGEGEKCSGAQQIAMMKKLAPDAKVQRKIFWENSAKLFRIKA